MNIDGDSTGSLCVEGFENTAIRTPEIVSVTYTVVYDSGAVVVGAVAHDGGDQPLEVTFRNARGSSTSLP